MTTVRLTAVVCLAEILGMSGFATVPALLPGFIAEWSLSNAEAGWLNGVFYLGYVAAVPVLVTLTDRQDARRIYLVACGLGAAGTAGFALFAEGVWSAMGWRILSGIGLAGTYMVGLRALTDRVAGETPSRSIAFYTSSFSVGASLSYALSGWIAAVVSWQITFLILALGPVLALLLVAVGLSPRPPSGAPDRRLLDFRPVLRNRRALGYILAYAAHSWELFGLRSWIVAFLVFAASFDESGARALWAAPTLAAIVNLLGLPSSVLGNEWAERQGRRRVVMVMMLMSAALAAGIGFTAGLPYGVIVALLALYGVTVTWDSASLTAGTVTAADSEYRGAAMALHSVIGFSGAVAGPLAFGIVLDLAGGGTTPAAWGLAFFSLGFVVALGPLALWRLGR